MDRDTFTVVCWPNVQSLMDKKGFDKNSSLINDEPLFEEYGNSAYFVRISWLWDINKSDKQLKITEDANIKN